MPQQPPDASVSKRTPTADVRSALVDSAVRVLERDGYAGLTVRAVATQAGVAPMGVYNHLDDKQGLVVAVLAEGFAGLRAAVTRQPGLTPPRALSEAGRGYRQFALSRPVTYGLMFGTTLPFNTHEILGPRAEPPFMALVELVLANQAVGAMIPGPPELLAMRIWSAVHGAVSLELAGAVIAGTPGDVYEGVLEMIELGLRPARS